TGRQFDEETGLYFYRARYYDAGKGRFLQRDPLGYVNGVNLYEYVTDRPTFTTDPTGLAPNGCCKITGISVEENPFIPAFVDRKKGRFDIVKPLRIIWAGENLSDCIFERYVLSVDRRKRVVAVTRAGAELAYTDEVVSGRDPDAVQFEKGGSD